MNWYVTSQNDDLFNNIYKLLITVYNDLGQNYCDRILHDILGSMVDLSILDSTIYQASMLALKNLNISSLTPEMQSAINDIILGFKGSAPRPEEETFPPIEGVAEEAMPDNAQEPSV